MSVFAAHRPAVLSRDRGMLLAPDGAHCVFVPYATGTLPDGSVDFVMPAGAHNWCQPCHLSRACPPSYRPAGEYECAASVSGVCACRPSRNGRPGVYGYWARVDL